MRQQLQVFTLLERLHMRVYVVIVERRRIPIAAVSTV